MFLSTGPTRSVSGTFSVLNNIIKTGFGSKVFVDNCYLPSKKDFDLFRKQKQGFLFGNVSHESWKSYDVIAISVSILPELYNLTSVLWFNNIPLGYNERMNSTIPPIIMGGVCSTMSDILYGKVSDNDSCLVDGVYVGHAEGGLNTMLRHFLYKKDLGKRESLKLLSQEITNFYVPAEYNFDWELDDQCGYKINSITPNEGYPESIRFDHGTEIMDRPGFEGKILNLDGENVTSGEIQISVGCSGGNSCSFCYEGVVAGPFKDVPLDVLQRKISELRLNSAPNTLSFYSYNLNYYYRFVDLLFEAASRFSQLSLINQRLDCIAARPYYLEIAKKIGLKRISLAIEGMGHRIRSGFLNKNADFDQIKEAYRVVFNTKLAEIKSGLILCGFEERQDFDDSLNEFREIIKMRDQMGVNTSMRVTICTTLDTLVPTNRGLIRADEVCDGDQIDRGGKVLEVLPNGEWPICSVTLVSGQNLRGVYEHPVLTPSGWRFLKDLVPGDEVHIPIGEGLFGTEIEKFELPICNSKKYYKGDANEIEGLKIEINELTGFVLGWLIGNGHLYKDNGFVNWMVKEEEIFAYAKIEKFLKSLGLRYSDKENYVSDACVIRKLLVSSRQLVSFFCNLGVRRGYGYQVPAVILRAPICVQREFLRALFMADGSSCLDFERNRRSIRLKSVAPKLLREVQLMLQNMGILSGITGRELGVYSPYLRAFVDVIGPISCDGRFTVEEMRAIDKPIEERNLRSRYNKDYMVGRVKSVVFSDIEETIGFRTETEEYVTNGFHSHNTPLVFYPHTPLQRRKKVTSLMNLDGARTLSYYLKGLKELGIRSKINGRSRSTFMEQFLLSFGRVGTSYIVRLSKEESLYYGSVSKQKEEELLNMFEMSGLEPRRFLQEIPMDRILWHTPVHVLEPKFLARGDKRLNVPLDEIEPARPCTVSPANAPFGTPGKRTVTCSMCGNCSSKEARMEIMTRKIESEHQPNDFFLAVQENKPRYMSVVNLMIKKSHYFMSAITASHILASRVLRLVPDILEPAFLQVGKNNVSWISGNYQKDWFSGLVTFPIRWKNQFDFDLTSPEVLNKLNVEFESFKVTKISSLQLNDRLVKLDHTNLFKVFMPGLSRSMIQSGMNTFSGDIPVAIKSTLKEMETKLDHTDVEPVVYAKDSPNGCTVIMALPVKYNPHLFLTVITPLKYQDIIESSECVSVFCLRETDYLCKQCGNLAVESVDGSFIPKLCKKCICGTILSKSSK